MSFLQSGRLKDAQVYGQLALLGQISSNQVFYAGKIDAILSSRTLCRVITICGSLFQADSVLTCSGNGLTALCPLG